MSRSKLPTPPPSQRERSRWSTPWHEVQCMFAESDASVYVHDHELMVAMLTLASSWMRAWIHMAGRLVYVGCPQLPPVTQSQETYPLPAPAADKTLEGMRAWKQDWNGRGFDAPRPGAISNALMSVNWFRNVAKVAKLPWCEPHVTASPDGEPVFEWWYDNRKLTIYFQEHSAEYVKVWGANIHTEMDDGPLCDFEPLLRWLTM